MAKINKQIIVTRNRPAPSIFLGNEALIKDTVVKKTSYSATSDYVLVILLLVFSGNPISRFLGTPGLMAVPVLIMLVKYRQINSDFFSKIFLVLVGLLGLFILQALVLRYVVWPAIFRYMSLFVFGGLVFNLVAERFSYRFFVVMYYASFMSLIGYLVVNLANIHPPGLVWGDERVTYLVYTFVEEHHLRNSGMFWEPGAFAGILTLCVALNIKSLPWLWKEHKFKIIVIIGALLTTQSTTGYLVFFITVMFYLIFFYNNTLLKITVVPALLLIIFIVYQNADFLQEKISSESEKSTKIVKGQFTNTRFGSLMLDMHYIQKHPLVGNGLTEVTRYADDPLLIKDVQSGINLANANGFSNFLACLGIPFMLFYFVSCFTQMKKVDGRVASLLVLVILLCFWGEQWLNFPIFAGMMFINVAPYRPEIKPKKFTF